MLTKLVRLSRQPTDQCDMVLSAANFKGHELTKTETDSILEAGFAVGGKCILGKRITVEFGPKKVRADVVKGTVATITSVAKGMPVLEFTKTIGKSEYTSTVAVKLANIETAPVPKDDCEAECAASPRVPKGYAFLVTEEGTTNDTVEIVPKWETTSKQRRCVPEGRADEHDWFPAS